MRLTVIGSGYVGLVAGACFSDAGNDVTMVDLVPEKVALLRSGVVPIYEPGLAEIIQANVERGRLSFTTDASSCVPDSDVVVLAVGTPSAPSGGVDLRALDGAARDVAKHLRDYTVVVTKSTVPPGTQRRLTELFRDLLAQTDAQVEVDVVANPEFLKEGTAVSDFLSPDRVIIGADSTRAHEVMSRLYAPFMRRERRLLAMDPLSAELTKYACNAMLATRISFMNELSRLCDQLGADVSQIRAGMGTDHRIGPHFLYASLGYGGSCFPKDVQALAHAGAAAGVPLGIVEATQRANAQQREDMVQRILRHFDGTVSGRRFGVWGLAFKARTDDVRESAALHVVSRLCDAGAHVTVHDPKALETARAVLGDRVTYTSDMMEAVDGADALVVCTEWSDYRMPDLAALADRMVGRVVFDGRNLYERDLFIGTEFTYLCVGRPPVRPGHHSDR